MNLDDIVKTFRTLSKGQQKTLLARLRVAMAEEGEQEIGPPPTGPDPPGGPPKP